MRQIRGNEKDTSRVILCYREGSVCIEYSSTVALSSQKKE